MHFSLIDRVVEWSPSQAGGGVGGRLVAIKLVSSAEEYLQDHFASFPVLPGVLMLEAFVQAARELLEREARSSVGETKGGGRMVLGRVRALKYGNFVPPGSTLRVEVEKVKVLEAGEVEFKGVGLVIHPASRGGSEESGGGGAEEATAVSGRFALRPVRLGDKA